MENGREDGRDGKRVDKDKIEDGKEGRAEESGGGRVAEDGTRDEIFKVGTMEGGMKDDERLKEGTMDVGMMDDVFKDGVGKNDGEDDRGGLLSVELTAEENTAELLIIDIDKDDDGTTGSDDDVALKRGWTAPLVVGAAAEEAVVMLDVNVASDRLMDDEVEALLVVVLGQRGADDDNDEGMGKPEDEPLGE